MKKKTMALGTLSLLVFGTVVAVTSAYAYQGNVNKTGPNYTPERYVRIQKAFTENNYADWKEQMGDRRITNKINEDNFSRFSKMHQLMLDGKTDEANAIRKELGLNQGNIHRGKNRRGNFVDANSDGVCDNYRK